ncbi:MAG: sulfite exporter TauE/SafE family protein [Bacteroidetes bacterium]|nr:sulfite exporter TauE/SafE family protein [Bacteroidota bacterium]MCL5268900.1 sulfite exporter TauE/SafE family protein [Bacteroidota bacterium]
MDIFNIYLPIAGIEFNALLLVLIGFCVGVLGGFFGVGGGWIVTPALNIFGFQMAFAIGTDLSNIFGQTIGAVKKHQKMGNIDWKLGLISIATSIVGLEIGSEVIIALEKAGDVGMIVRWCYMLLLWGLGSYMLRDYYAMRPRESKDEDMGREQSSRNKSGNGRPRISERLHRITIPPMISFPSSGIEGVSIWIILLVFLFTGFLSGFLGVGGGFIIMPALVYLIGLPTAVAVGTSLVTVLFSGAYGCFTYALKGRVEMIAALILLVGSAIGVQIGATAVKYIRGYGIRLLFAVMILLAGCSIAIEQVYKLTDIAVYSTTAGLVIMGTAMCMVLIIIVRLVLESKRGKKLRL